MDFLKNVKQLDGYGKFDAVHKLHN